MDRELSVKCPKCKAKILIPAAKQPDQSFQDPFGERRNALICVGGDDLKKMAVAVIKQIGLNIEVVTTTKAALNKMEYHIYHLVIMDDAFDGGKGVSGLMERLNSIDMSLRRRICLIRISNKFHTSDDMASLHSSVNTILHSNDIIQLESFLSRALMEHKNFYTVYNDSLKLAGKA